MNKHMNLTLKFQFVAVSLLTAISTQLVGQGTFQNLDFESGLFVPAPTPQNPFAVQWAPAMPGWTGFIGANQQTEISHNALSLSVANIAIQGPDYPSPNLYHGQFYVVLQSGLDPTTGQSLVGAAIAQTGTIPTSAQSIRLMSNNPFSLGFSLLFGNQLIPLANIGTDVNGRPLWGGDISPFAGQNGELRFQGAGTLDYIQFSSQPIPEPSVLGLFGLGVLLLGRGSHLVTRS